MRRWTVKIILCCLALGLAACSKANSNSTAALVDASGKHPAGWVQKHWTLVGGLARKTQADAAQAAVAGGIACVQCHGADLLGGISKVSCFTQGVNGQACHFGVLGHPTDWASPLRHGQGQMLTGSNVPVELREQGGGAMSAPGTSAGFAYCASCHGSNFEGNGTAVTCLNAACHLSANAPHTARWIGGTVNHKGNSPLLASVCIKCHAGGNNFGPQLPGAADPAAPAPPTPSCFNTTLCHGATPSPHPATAVYLQAGQHGLDAADKHNPNDPNGLNPKGLISCYTCHGFSDGRFNRPVNNMSNGCETCHAPRTAHPTPWLPGRPGTPTEVPSPANPNTTSHATISAASIGSSCTLCHGANLDGVAGKGNAPSCTSGNRLFGVSCHATSPLAQPAGCTSCHNGTNGLSLFSASKPATGAHAAHLALPGISCSACHAGAGADPATGIGAAHHADGFLNLSTAVYWGRNGGMRFNGSTCSNTRCHGGQTTPAWLTGSLDPTTECRSCHEQGDAGNTPQTPQFNSFYSGLYTGVFPAVNLHQFHLTVNNPLAVPSRLIFCTDCHGVDKLTNQRHFGGLNLKGFQTSVGNTPGDTIELPGGATYFFDNVTQSYPGTCNNVVCHSFASPNSSWGK